MQVAVLLEEVAQIQKLLDLVENLGRQTIREIDEVIDLQIARHQLHIAILIEAATVGAGGKVARGDAARLERRRIGRLSTARGGLPTSTDSIRAVGISCACSPFGARVGSNSCRSRSDPWVVPCRGGVQLINGIIWQRHWRTVGWALACGCARMARVIGL